MNFCDPLSHIFGEVSKLQNQFLKPEWNPDCCFVGAVIVLCPIRYDGQTNIILISMVTIRLSTKVDFS